MTSSELPPLNEGSAIEAPPSVVAAPPRPDRARWLLVVAALIGGALGWYLLQEHGEPLKPTDEMLGMLARRTFAPLTPEENARLEELERNLEVGNAVASLALAGTAIGALVGLAAGLLAPAKVRSLLGLVVGGLFGALAGGAGGLFAMLAYRGLKIDAGVSASYAAMTAHLVIWVLLAVVLAVVVRLSHGRGAGVGALLAGALAGAIAATVLFPLLAAIAFPMSNTDILIPSGAWTRLFWVELGAAAIAMGLVRALRPAVVPAD